MNKLFEDLIGAFGVSGHENEIRNIITGYLDSMKIEYEIDKMGNVIVIMGQKDAPMEKRHMIVSHMDTMGFVVTYVEESGFLRIAKIGEFAGEELANNLVEFENGNSGRLCISKKNGTVDDMYIDLGVSSRDEAYELISDGDACMVSSNVIEEENTIIAPSLDNRAGCYMLMKVIEKLHNESVKDLEKKLFFVFSTQNNLGARGARAAAYIKDPMYALVVAGEPSGDSIGADGKLKLGKGTAIKFMDNSLVMHHEIKEKLEAVYEKLDKKPKYVFGENKTDGWFIHKEGMGVKTGTLVYPVRYDHTNAEMVSYDDIEEGINIIYNYVIE